MRFSEEYKLVPVIEPKDYGSAGIDSDSVHMGRLHSIALCFLFGLITGNSILKLYSGASAGTKTTALAFQYRFGQGDYKAASADGLGSLVDVASTGLTLTAATFDHRTVIIEFRPQQMTTDEPWLTAEIDATATVMNVACQGIANARVSAKDGPTLI